MSQPRQVMSARRALDVLCAFSAERPEWSVTELSQHPATLPVLVRHGLWSSTNARLRMPRRTRLHCAPPRTPPPGRTWC